MPTKKNKLPIEPWPTTAKGGADPAAADPAAADPAAADPAAADPAAADPAAADPAAADPAAAEPAAGGEPTAGEHYGRGPGMAALPAAAEPDAEAAVAGLDHLNGETVVVKIDAAEPEATADDVAPDVERGKVPNIAARASRSAAANNANRAQATADHPVKSPVIDRTQVGRPSMASKNATSNAARAVAAGAKPVVGSVPVEFDGPPFDDLTRAEQVTRCRDCLADVAAALVEAGFAPIVRRRLLGVVQRLK